MHLDFAITKFKLNLIIFVLTTKKVKTYTFMRMFTEAEFEKNYLDKKIICLNYVFTYRLNINK